MSNLIETQPISGFKIYGQQMFDYITEATSARDFGTAIAIASLAEASAIEVETIAYGSVLRARQKKLSDLGNALAIISKAIASMNRGDEPQSSDKSDADSELRTASGLLTYYGIFDKNGNISLPVDKDNKVDREHAETSRTNTEYAMDLEDNDMQQDMITLQGLMSKRDNSFSTAAKILRKVDSTGASIINSIGG